MTPAALLSELRAAGAALRVVGGRLEAKALPPALAPLARVWAAELRRLLEQPADPAQFARLEAPGPELPPDVDPADPAAPSPSGYPDPPAPVLAPDPAQLEAAELPAHLRDTPEAWAAFLGEALWIGPAERRRILADARSL